MEHIWDELREKHFGNRAFPSLDALIEVLCQGLNQLADDPERLRSLTDFPHLNVPFSMRIGISHLGIGEAA